MRNNTCDLIDIGIEAQQMRTIWRNCQRQFYGYWDHRIFFHYAPIFRCSWTPVNIGKSEEWVSLKISSLQIAIHRLSNVHYERKYLRTEHSTNKCDEFSPHTHLTSNFSLVDAAFNFFIFHQCEQSIFVSKCAQVWCNVNAAVAKMALAA